MSAVSRVYPVTRRALTVRVSSGAAVATMTMGSECGAEPRSAPVSVTPVRLVVARPHVGEAGPLTSVVIEGR